MTMPKKRKWSDFTKAHKFPSSPAQSSPEPAGVDITPVELYVDRLNKWIEIQLEQGMSPDIAREIRAYTKSLLAGDSREAILESFTNNQTSLPFFKELYGAPDKDGLELPTAKPNWQFLLDYEKEAQKIKQVEQPKFYGDTGKTQLVGERQAEQRGLGEGYGALFGTQSDIRQREDLIARKQAELDAISNQGRAEQRSSALSASAFGSPASEAQQRAELFKQFEEVKQEKLSQLDPEMDWVQRWFVEHEENPYTPITPTTQDRIDQLSVELQKWQDIGQNYADAPVNPGDAITWGQVADESKERIMQMLETIKNAPPDGVSPVVNTPREVAPATPEWLSKLVPGLKTGQPIKSNVELPTPSLQEWSRLNPSTQTQYAGFSKWAGTPIKDTLARMNLMRPETPRGAGRFNWNVARQ